MQIIAAFRPRTAVGLFGLPQSEAAAQVLGNLRNSWVRLANQADLYAEIKRREGNQR